MGSWGVGFFSNDNAADVRENLAANRCSARRHLLAGAALGLALGGVAACGSQPDPAGSGGLVGHMSGTSDVAGQPGDPAVGGGGLALVPIAAMDGPFWDLIGEEPIANPPAWSRLAAQLSRVQVANLGGKVAPIDADGDFRVKAAPGKYAVCYWPSGTEGRVWGCSAVELPTKGELEASFGEGGFHIGVVD